MGISFKKSLSIRLILILLFLSFKALASTTLPHQWTPLNKILNARLEQTSPKMKLNESQIHSFVAFLNGFSARDLVRLQKLQKTMPKTTLELLIAMQSRELDKDEAQKMAAYLQQVPHDYHIKNLAAFDENTSHIIGREWHEIDYSGEGMTWEGQKAKYESYGITHFKSLENLKKFFPVESQLAYFKEAYDIK